MSRIRLDTEKRSTQMALASPSKFHGAVENCFDWNNKGSESESVSGIIRERKLWRIDQLAGNYYLLLLSSKEPNLQKFKNQFGYPGDADEIKNYDNLLKRAVKGSVWQFRLAANPTHTVKESQEKRGKVVAHTSEKYQMEWLYQKAAQNGFTVLTEDSCVMSSEWKIFYKKGGNNKNRVRVKETTYQGMLRVDDSELFQCALINGIGREKAYGMGLLTIMRV